MSGLPSTVKVKEVGPRDGLQSESVVLAIENKLRLIDCLGAAGLREIEATSFVSTKPIPALADAVEVFANLERRPGATGNICTEDLVHMLHEMGIATGVDLEALIGCARLLEEFLGHGLPGQIMKAGICGHLTEAS